jgi:hypothetical protein
MLSTESEGAENAEEKKGGTKKVALIVTRGW